MSPLLTRAGIPQFRSGLPVRPAAPPARPGFGRDTRERHRILDPCSRRSCFGSDAALRDGLIRRGAGLPGALKRRSVGLMWDLVAASGLGDLAGFGEL